MYIYECLQHKWKRTAFVTLSHAIEQTPSHSQLALSELSTTIKDKIRQAKKGARFEELEKEIHAAFVEAQQLVLSETLEQYDINVPSVNFNGKEYGQVLRCEQTYLTAAGPVRVERSLYRTKNATHCICPMELRTGIIENRWSPRAAKQALLFVSQLTPYEAERLFKELGAMQPSKSSLDRLPKKLNHQWKEKREAFELSLRQEVEIPEKAVSIAVSLDGVLIPMQGGVVLPGDSRYEEASCGTLTYYDKCGDPLAIRRYGCMPEHKKLRMKEFLSH